MTSVVIWRQRELWAHDWLQNGDLWIAADTRLSSQTERGRAHATDAALKILPITLELHQEREDGSPGRRRVYLAELAYAWAGDMLPATATFALASSYLKRMTAPAFAALPSIEDVASFVERIGVRYAAETMRGFECFLAGSSPGSKGFRDERAFKMTFSRSGTSRCVEVDLAATSSFALLGSHQAEIGTTIAKGLQDDVEYVPGRAIKDVISSGHADDIGGHLNVARIARNQVEIYPEWRNPDGGLPRPYADSEIGGIGEWMVTGIYGQ